MRFALFPLILSLLPPGLIAQQNPATTPNSQPNVFFGDKEKKVKGSTRPVHGIVKDSAGNSVAQAIVELKDVKTGKKMETVTREDGSYRFEDLKIADDYEFQASHDKLSSPLKKLSLYDTRKDPVINFELEPKKDVKPQAKQ